ncbi:MAG TPA: MarP family serine protease [Solirubrobacteraceae bacterium]
MTALDWIILALTLATAAAGFFQGFVVGAATLAGFAGGLLVGARLGQSLVASGSHSPYAPLFGLIGALLGGILFGSVLEAFGHGVRRRMTVMPSLGVVDGLAGALLSAAVALGVVWLAGAVALQSPQTRGLRDDIQRSAILRALNGTLPPSGPILNALARFDPFPTINGPPVDLPAPRAAIARDPDVRAAAQGVVKIQGLACGLGVEGSGWIARPGVVVTNAHVVAGQDDTTVQLAGTGPLHAAHAVVFDPQDDVAILRVDGLGGRVLPIASDPRPGRSAAILGFPENGPYDVRAGRLGETRSVITQDAYGRGPVQRSITTLRGTVRPGNSGGPMVDARGRVVTTVFAAARSGPAGGYGVPNSVVQRELARAGTGTVSTGPCAR